MRARTLNKKFNTKVYTQTNTQSVLRQVTNIVLFASVITVNALANILPINGITTGDLSDAFPSLFTPAGYVFSIWALIYSLLIGFVIYQARPSTKRNITLMRLGYVFALNCLFNIAWIFAWHYQAVVLSHVFMLGILATLIFIYERIHHTRRLSNSEYFAIKLPFSIYLGWITVATVASTAVTLLQLGVTGGSFAPVITALVIAAATIIGLLVLGNRQDGAFVMVLIWAFAGIAVKQWGSVQLVAIAALVAIVILLLGFVGNARLRSSYDY